MLKIRQINLSELNSESYLDLAESIKYNVNIIDKWFECYLEHFSHLGSELTLELFDSDNQKTYGLLPMIKYLSQENRFISLQKLIPNGFRPTDFFPFVVKKGYEEIFASEISNWLKINYKLWDKIMINQIPESDLVWKILVRKLSENGIYSIANNDKEFLKIDTSGSFDDYQKKLGSKKRNNLRRRISISNKELGGIEAEHLDKGLINYYEQFLYFFNQRKDYKNQSNPFERLNTLEPFVRNIILEYEKVGKIGLQILSSGENIIGLKYYLKSNGIVYDYLTTFDNSFAKYYIGQMAYENMTRFCFSDNNIKEFNFMRSVYPQKLWWKPENENFIKIKIINKKSVPNKINDAIIRLKNKFKG